MKPPDQMNDQEFRIALLRWMRVIAAFLNILILILSFAYHGDQVGNILLVASFILWIWWSVARVRGERQ